MSSSGLRTMSDPGIGSATKIKPMSDPTNEISQELPDSKPPGSGSGSGLEGTETTPTEEFIPKNRSRYNPTLISIQTAASGAIHRLCFLDGAIMLVLLVVIIGYTVVKNQEKGITQNLILEVTFVCGIPFSYFMTFAWGMYCDKLTKKNCKNDIPFRIWVLLRCSSIIPSFGTLILAIFAISTEGFASIIILTLSIFGFMLYVTWFVGTFWYSWIVWAYAYYLKKNKLYFTQNPNGKTESKISLTETGSKEVANNIGSK